MQNPYSGTSLQESRNDALLNAYRSRSQATLYNLASTKRPWPRAAVQLTPTTRVRTLPLLGVDAALSATKIEGDGGDRLRVHRLIHLHARRRGRPLAPCPLADAVALPNLL